MPSALEGIKILEVGDQLTQYAGKLLADMGAEVIKVEPSEGAGSRYIGPFYKDETDVNQSLYFWHYNTSKKSVTLDLENEKDRLILSDMIKEADVVLEDGKPGQMKAWGLDYETISTIHPDLIYCSITPFGQTGPWSEYASSDLIQLALGGIMAVTGYDDVPDAPPMAPTGGQSNHLAGYFAAMGIVSALLHRDMATGGGQYIDIAVHDCVTVSTEMSIPYWEYQKAHVHRQTGRHALPNKSSRWNFLCKDGRYILCLNTYLSPGRWRELVAWLASKGMQEELDDKRYVNDQFRASHMDYVCQVLESFCAQHDSEYIFHYAQSIGLPWAPVRAPEDMLSDEHLVEDRKVFVQVEHPELKETITYPGAPYLFHETPWSISSRPPLLGEHNALIKEVSNAR
ncbi:CaiB/BaiF CoA-transferase family protein [Ammoniphilus sp. YIM 78166]|uniref:CaiB/BaiF CoA transferase family protein n=1 Tax=Ammoniphilus sp. YIM 78166 TaxID=1644106 RepID=UPI00106F4331|nr:CoA transferase [Ammoniphilus sp. YIM 78166]